MYFWDINKILDSIRNDKFSEFDKLKYYILSSLIAMSIAFETFDFTSYVGIIKIFAMISTTVIGILYLYNKNKQYDGKYFIERTIIFTLPLFIRVTLIAIPIGLVVGIFLAASGNGDIIESGYFSLTLGLILTIIGFFWEAHWFSRLHKNDITATEDGIDE